MTAWSDSDVDLYVSMCARLGVKPLDLGGVMMSESGLDPLARNPRNEALPPIAVGLIQWTRAAVPHGDLDALRHDPIAKQLARVEAYYAPHRGKLTSPGAVYLVNWLPALAEHGDVPTFVCAAALGPFAWAYRDNPSLDVDHDGRITVNDLSTRILRVQQGAVWTAWASRVRAAVALQDTLPDTLPEVNEMNRDAVTVPDVTAEVFPGGDDDEGPAAA